MRDSIRLIGFQAFLPRERAAICAETEVSINQEVQGLWYRYNIGSSLN